MSHRFGIGTAALVTLLAGCTTEPSAGPAAPPSVASTTSAPSSAAPGPSATATAGTPETTPSAGPARRPGRPRLDSWEIGARTLPLAADGFGVRRPTPPELRVRVMPTITNLPPPKTDRFVGSVGPITPWVRNRMGTSWERGCPVALRDLRYVRVTFHGFDRRPHTGELVIRAGHARGIVRVFRRLYAVRFPIEQMTLPTSNERDLTPSGDGNGTGAMVCRPTTGQTNWSAHALGLAIDVNPFQNPYVKGDLVLPELAGAYRDRSWRRPGMIRPGGVVVRAFASIGWSWGGGWRTLKDYQHFSALDR